MRILSGAGRGACRCREVNEDEEDEDDDEPADIMAAILRYASAALPLRVAGPELELEVELVERESLAASACCCLRSALTCVRISLTMSCASSCVSS